MLNLVWMESKEDWRLGRFVWIVTVVLLLLLLAARPCDGRGNRDIMHDDADTPKQPGCENSFVLVSSACVYYNLME